MTLMAAPDFQEKRALLEHREQLLQKRKQLDLLIENVEKTIATKEGENYHDWS